MTVTRVPQKPPRWNHRGDGKGLTNKAVNKLAALIGQNPQARQEQIPVKIQTGLPAPNYSKLSSEETSVKHWLSP